MGIIILISDLHYMIIKTLFFKIKIYVWYKIVKNFRSKSYYPIIYKSYWHLKLQKNLTTQPFKNYFAARPNPGAGIGHQMANWIAGYWFAQQFGLKFAHTPFPNKKWDEFLGFGEGEITVSDLKRKGYKKVLLPLFDENNPKEVGLIKNIINSYEQQKTVFIAEQDQFYGDQFGNIEKLKEKFYHAPARNKDSLIYNKEDFNIAIHVRRGDIVAGLENNNPNLLMRFQSNAYFTQILANTLAILNTEKPIAIYVFSQGVTEDFQEFEQFKNVHYCMDMNVQDSFLHMVYADALITSKSSFSYKPALLNNGIKICPKNFWHGYPIDDNWILADENGVLAYKNQLK